MAPVSPTPISIPSSPYPLDLLNTISEVCQIIDTLLALVALFLAWIYRPWKRKYISTRSHYTITLVIMNRKSKRQNPHSGQE